MARIRRGAGGSPVRMVDRESLTPDTSNPRKSDPARMGLLKLSLAKLGFVMPLFADANTGLLLSGHQRLTTAAELAISRVPVIYIDVAEHDIKGINILFNRATNDFSAFDTGSKAHGKMDLDSVIAAAEALPDFEGEDFFVINVKSEKIGETLNIDNLHYDKKATVVAGNLMKMNIKIPIVASISGQIINGVHRAIAAMEGGEPHWPVIRIPDEYAEVALNFLNYLSMDFHVDEDFRKLIRYSAYRRPQNNRGAVPKAMRFWANGERTLLDRDSYSVDYWRKFRDIHGNVLDFGAGLCRAAPYLREKDIVAYDFEPYLIDPGSDSGMPSSSYSRLKAREFLAMIADPRLKFDSIFLCSVLNSVPFPEDRLAVLAIVHALCTRATAVYGTLRDISDFNYEYSGLRNPNYFTFDTEPGVRVGDVMRNPKLQKFHSEEEAREMFGRFWNNIEFWPGGNVFYFKLTAPKGINPTVVGKALELEFDLPYSDNTKMGLVADAKSAFSKRLMLTVK